MYYIIINGAQQGPFGKEELRIKGLSPDTFVWRAGLADWTKASQLPELSDLFFGDSAFGAYTQPEQAPGANRYPDYGAPNNPGAGQPPYGAPNPPYGQQPYGQQPYGQNGYGYERPHSDYPQNYFNWLPWAIAGTVFGFLFSCIGGIFGIIGIINANKANSAYAAGLREAGDVSNGTAKTMTLISLVLVGVGIIVSVIGISTNMFALPGML